MCGRRDDDSINVRLFPFAYFAPVCIFKEKYYKLTEDVRHRTKTNGIGTSNPSN